MNQAKEFIIDCKNFSANLVYNCISAKSTWCHAIEKFEATSKDNAINDFEAQAISKG